jgi:GT2 family glycosyltransferase
MGSKREIKSQDSPPVARETWPKVAIVVLNWNGWRDTIECLESLQQITYPNYQIIVVDNGSTDDSVEKINDWAQGELTVQSRFLSYDPSTKPLYWTEYDQQAAEGGGIPSEEAKIARARSGRSLIVIRNEVNLGFAAGNNVALQYALKRTFDFSLLLNNDTVVDPQALTSLIREAMRNPACGIVGSKVVYYDRPQIIHHAGGIVLPWKGQAQNIGMGQPDEGQFNQVKKVDFVTGCSMLVDRRMIRVVGMLDEEYFVYWEDADWCVRSWQKGWEVVYAPGSIVYHRASRMLGQSSPAKTYYRARNSLKFVKCNYQWLLILAPIWWPRYFFFNHLVKGRFSHLTASLRGLRDFLFARYGGLHAGSRLFRAPNVDK